MKDKFLEFLSHELLKLKEQSLFRDIPNLREQNGTMLRNGNGIYVNLCSNNYLGFGFDSKLQDEFFHFILDKTEYHWLTSGASRLLTGNSQSYEALESLLSSLYKTQSCLIFGSGYHAHLGIIPALSSSEDAIFADRFCHASILDGIRLSGARLFRYAHLDMEHLSDLLKKERHKYKKAFIISESIFSMDGDIAPTKILVELKNQFNAILILDEAHAVGVYGPQGKGIAAKENTLSEVDILVGTFGKAYASLGAFVISHPLVKQFLIRRLHLNFHLDASEECIVNQGHGIEVRAENQEHAKRDNNGLPGV